MMDDTLSTVKFEELDAEYSANNSSSVSPEPDFSVKLAELEERVLKLIEYVMKDISELKKVSQKDQRTDKENLNSDNYKCRIYVGNINTSTTIDQLTTYFSTYGSVNHAYFFRYFSTCRNAFLEFKDTIAVEKSLNSSHYLNGRHLTVGRAKPKSNLNTKEPLGYKSKNSDLKTLRYRPY